MASFTKAAAKELVSRDQVIENDQIGTLHAQCFRMLGNPKIAEANVKDFNEEFPHLALSANDEVRLDDGLVGPDGLDEAGEKGGDDLLAQLNVYRARMVKKELWLPSVLDFYRHWERYKREEGLMDFQDLIERATELNLSTSRSAGHLRQVRGRYGRAGRDRHHAERAG